MSLLFMMKKTQYKALLFGKTDIKIEQSLLQNPLFLKILIHHSISQAKMLEGEVFLVSLPKRTFISYMTLYMKILNLVQYKL